MLTRQYVWNNIFPVHKIIFPCYFENYECVLNVPLIEILLHINLIFNFISDMIIELYACKLYDILYSLSVDFSDI